MKPFIYTAGLMAMLLLPSEVQAQNRYVEPPPVLVSPDLSAPWVMQLRQAPTQARPLQRPRRMENGRLSYDEWRTLQEPPKRRPVAPHYQARPVPQAPQVPQVQQELRTAAVAPRPMDLSKVDIDPKFLPQEVTYEGTHAPGTLVVDTEQRFLYLVQQDGKARRYGIGVGKPGFEWAGTHTVSQKREWPDWRPPAEMIAREKRKGRVLPTFVKGGPQNPLGARALYLGSTLYRIHGTNAPWSIGQAVSSGCIRMRNEDVIDLYERVPIGAKVVVI